MAGQQQEEIETIRSRTIEVKLSDADVKRISEKAAAHGLTVGELIENFIGDLVCGTYSNGSDERMYAEQWFERCWFGMFPDLTFLRYLIEWGGLDEVIGCSFSGGMVRQGKMYSPCRSYLPPISSKIDCTICFSSK